MRAASSSRRQFAARVAVGPRDERGDLLDGAGGEFVVRGEAPGRQFAARRRRGPPNDCLLECGDDSDMEERGDPSTMQVALRACVTRRRGVSSRLASPSWVGLGDALDDVEASWVVRDVAPGTSASRATLRIEFGGG